jgi:uncharacterized protein YjbI with pentapeptide repeats
MSDEPTAAPQRSTSDEDRDGWTAYWTAQGMPWRTEPEIDEERQHYLAQRRALQPDIERGIYPFKDIKLDRADVEWLLVTHESGGIRGPVDWSDSKQQGRDGLDLRGVDLRAADLSRLPLACLRAGLHLSELRFSTPAQPEVEMIPSYDTPAGVEASAVHLESACLDGAHLENACLHLAHLEDALLADAHLEAALLVNAELERAGMIRCHLEGAVAVGANFEGAILLDAHFEHATLLWARFSGSVLGGTHFEDANLGRAAFSDTTILNGAWLGSRDNGLMGLHDVRWGGADVALVRWVTERSRRRHGGGAETEPWQSASARASASLLEGLESHDTAASQLLADRRALRANRQVALLLRNQGLHEEADRFAYRAQLLQRQVLRRERHWLRSLGSLLLDLISGYGYRPLRSLMTYLLVVALFGLAYWALGVATGHTLTWNEAGVVSLTAFHGRGFFSTAFSPGDPQAALAAIEAVLGLLIEITFIATFTQRFFAR